MQAKIRRKTCLTVTERQDRATSVYLWLILILCGEGREGVMSIQQEQSPQLPQWALPEQSLPFPAPLIRKGFFSGKIGPVPFWAIILTLVIIVVVGAGISWSMLSSTAATIRSNATSASIATDTPIPQLMTTHTFTGYGVEKTEVFHVTDNWKIIWSCNPSSFFGHHYDLIVSVNNAAGKTIDFAAVNVTCAPGYTTDVQEEHQSGDIYLDITSEGAWNIQVQELE
jgi:hypothetical protein